MTRIQIASVEEPFNQWRLGAPAARVLGRAEAMGLLPGTQPIVSLNYGVMRSMVGALRRAGIGREAGIGLLAPNSLTTEELAGLLDRLLDSMEESPVPDHEVRQLIDVLGLELVGRLVGASTTTLRRYASLARKPSTAVAARIHYLALLVGDLAGSYTDFGIRRWFERKRSQLAGRSPLEVLKGSWNPDADGPREVRTLALALTSLPGT